MTITILQVDADTTTLLPKYTAQQSRQAQAATHGGGSGRRLGGRSGFRVDTPSTVLTATSTTWTLGPCAAMIDPGATTHQGMYGWSSDANETGTVTASDATYTRRDIVYIRVNDSSAGDGSGALSAPVLYLAGVADATGAAPALPPRSFLVATITVPPGVGTPSVVLNPARYVAAGGILPVADDAERLALTGYEGLRVDQFDVDRTYRHNGTRWGQSVDTVIGRAQLAAAVLVAATPAWTDLATVTGVTLGGEVTIDFSALLTNPNSGAHRDAAVKVICDGADVDSYSFTIQLVAGQVIPAFPAMKFFHTPAAGSHTWKLQANASAVGSVNAARAAMTVTEKP